MKEWLTIFKEKTIEKRKEIIQQMPQCSSFSTAKTVSSYATSCLDSDANFTNFFRKRGENGGRMGDQGIFAS